MPWQMPKLKDLRDAALSDLRAHFPETEILRRSNLAVTAETFAGLLHGQYDFLRWLQGQIFVDTAEAEFLVRHARIWGIARKPAGRATGTLTATGTNGATIPAGAILARADGARVETTADATIAGGTAALSVRAVTAGAAGNADIATAYQFEAALAGVDAEATVADAGDGTGLAGGADAEADALLRARTLARIQAPPHGGAKRDYEAWALEVEGVTRAWPLANWTGVGTIGLAIAADEDPDGPIPPAALVDAVQAHVDPLRPVTADLTVFAPTPLAVDITIADLVPDTAKVRAAIELELADLFRRESDLGAVLPRSKIWEAVSLATGENSHAIQAPAADVAPAAAELPVLGVVSYV